MENKVFAGLTILFSLFAGICYAVDLSPQGHIIESRQIKNSDIQYFMKDGKYFIMYNGLELAGNSLYKIYNGVLTLTTIAENLPCVMRIYDASGVLKYSNKFPKIINITFSATKKFASFFDGKQLITLNLNSFKIEKFAGNSIFDIDENGIPVYYNEIERSIFYGKRTFVFEENPVKYIFFQGDILFFTRDAMYELTDKPHKLFTFKGIFFDAEISDNSLYIVNRIRKEDRFEYILKEFSADGNLIPILRKSFSRKIPRTHEPIGSPLNYGSPNHEFPIGNSYGEIQNYGTSNYLHPGVDFLGDDFQDVFAVREGIVKAIITTGGDPYWRIAIGNEDSPAEGEGYLYAHLNQSSMPFTVGDWVNAGEFIGTLYPWGYYDFTHIHFARIISSGNTWNGNWWTADDPLPDVVNIQDSIPPIFENAVENDLFAFRDEYGNYLEPDALSGEIDIIAKCHDIANCDWRIDVHELSFKFHPIYDPAATVYEQLAFIYDFPLDVYVAGGSYVDLVMNTIYSRDATCYSVGNYDEREYFHIISHSNGDSLITAEDAEQMFPTSILDDGVYLLEVIAKDCSMNETSAMMEIEIDNYAVSDNPDIKKLTLENYPNPFSHSTTISLQFPAEGTNNPKLEIYNLKGQLIREFNINYNNSQNIELVWNGTDGNEQICPNGIYFYKLVTNQNQKVNKMILIR